MKISFYSVDIKIVHAENLSEGGTSFAAITGFDGNNLGNYMLIEFRQDDDPFGVISATLNKNQARYFMNFIKAFLEQEQLKF
jgi:hypothetical protein